MAMRTGSVWPTTTTPARLALKLMSPTWERSTDNNHNYVLTDNVPMPGRAEAGWWRMPAAEAGPF